MNRSAYLFLGLCLLGCDSHPNKSETTEINNRFADFNDHIVVQTGISGGSSSARWREKLSFRLEPTRIGAYFLEARSLQGKELEFPFTAKYISSNENAAPIPTYDLPLSTGIVMVTFSDGKSIERTTIEIKP